MPKVLDFFVIYSRRALIGGLDAYKFSPFSVNLFSITNKVLTIIFARGVCVCVCGGGGGVAYSTARLGIY